MAPDAAGLAGTGRRLLTLASASLGGYAAFALGVPLPWVLGSMIGTAIMMLLGFGN